MNDAATDRTYEYQMTGDAVENYALGAGNTAPRGAASTAAGTSVWVVDANKNVYVYDTGGALVGSWTAGGLPSNASLQGIATDGTDVWLVDAQSDKVYRYTGAATRTSGSQNAASSFSLNSGNKDPKDIVTDGSYLWTVNDSANDYVFKYTMAGTYVGKWKISTSGPKAPTGITLDPANPTHIWIVDSGTDRVYQYDNAANLTSGSLSASVNFALAPGNTDPQGIADPAGFAPSTRPGDFDSDSVLGAADIDLLFAQLRLPQPDRASRFDLTGDGRVDEADRDRLIRDLLHTDFGDASLDGRFDSADLERVLQAGKYEDAIDGNCTWGDGDWDGDGDFTSSDLVLAFQTGRYEVP